MSESDLEHELRTLTPAAPGPKLEKEIANELKNATLRLPASAGVLPAVVSQAQLWWQRLTWAAVGAAAAVAVTLTLSARGPGELASSSQAPTVAAREEEPHLFRPLHSQREVVASEDGGVIYDSQAAPTQVVRYSSVERHSWENAAGAVVEVEVPREDVLFVPVNYQ
jgi:hypothetical protein